MTVTATNSELMQRLDAIRRTAQRRLVVYGICAVASGGVYALLFILSVDWLFHLPPTPRMMTAFFFLLGFILATGHWIVRPMRRPVNVPEIAGRLEKHFKHLADRLSSTVSFHQFADAGSPQLMRQVILNTEQIVAGIPLESVLTLRPIALRLALLVGSAGIIGAVYASSPGWMRTGLSRYLDPLGGVEWPTVVALVPESGDLRVPLGESATVRMQVVRGLSPTLRGVVHVMDADGHRSRLTMSRDGDGFFAEIDGITSDLEYWFEAGDAHTRSAPGHIAVVQRPAVASALVRIYPPAYAADRPVVEQPLTAAPIEATIGSRMEFDIVSTKPVPTAAAGPGVGLLTQDDRLLPLDADPNDPATLHGSLTVTEDATFRVALIDDEGFTNRGAELHTIIARPDRAPTTAILEPRALIEATPRATIELLARAEDDLGVQSLQLRIESPRGQTTLPLTLQSGSASPAERAIVTAELDLSLADLAPQPQDMLVLQTEARDRAPSDPPGGQVGLSAPVRIKVISEADFDERLRDELAAIEARIRQHSLEQGDVLDKARDLAARADGGEPLGDDDRDMAGALGGGEARIGRMLIELSRRAKRLSRRIEANVPQDRSNVERTDALGDALARIASADVASATSSLNRLREPLSPEEQAEQAAQAVASGQLALQGLKSLLDEISQWSDFQTLITRTRDVLDRQEEIRAATQALAKATLGKPLESLTPEERAALNQVQRRQQQLGDDVDQLLARLRQNLQSLEESNPGAAEAIDRALREAAALDLDRHLRDAEEALAQNRSAAAGLNQKSAAEALRGMIAGLESRQDRELEELRKRGEDAEAALAALIEAQREILTSTQEARMIGADEAAFADLAERQRTTRRNAERVADDLAGMPRAEEPVDLTRQAAGRMRDAEDALEPQRSADAEGAQADAIVLLERALEAIVQLNEQTRQEMTQRTLSRIREGLENLLAAQQALHQGIVDLRDAVAQAGRVGRLEARAASSLSRDQTDIKGMMADLAPQLENVPVFEWALERASKWMDQIIDDLNLRKVDDDLVALSQRIVDELQRLVHALESTLSMAQDSQFAESGAGGGAGDAGGQQQTRGPVPTVTELLVLKALQTELNERTRAMAETLDPATATEAELRQVRELAEDQAQVQELARQVTEKARSGP